MTPTPARPEDGKPTAGQGTYADFLAGKARTVHDAGPHCTPDDVHPSLFDFQRHITAWAVRKGRAAIWADTGLGKTRMQVEWCRLVGGRALILAPLAVAEQTVREAASIGVRAAYVRDQAEADALAPGWIAVTNYDRLHLIDPAAYRAVVLDESSILKAFSGATKKALIKAFRATPYRLACTATPAPNDIEELCNHADFLGVMTANEMRSTFFIADSRGQFMKYRLKGHAHGAFYQWLASWAIACRTPADLGFDGSAYELPPLSIEATFVPTGWAPDGELFAARLEGVTQRAQVRRETLNARVRAAVDLVLAEPDEPWLIWCGLNSEADAMAEALGAVNVQGSDPADVKAARLLDFAAGRIPRLVTKTAVAGFGLNLQVCARMAFVGLSDSYEAYYQAIRRCHRYGQTRPVHAHLILADVERPILANVLAKEATARQVSAGLVAEVAAENRAELFHGTSKGDDYDPRRPLRLPEWMTA